MITIEMPTQRINKLKYWDKIFLNHYIIPKIILNNVSNGASPEFAIINLV